MGVRIIEGDCLAVLPTLEANSVECVVTDPPYHLTSGNTAVDWGAMPLRSAKSPNPRMTNIAGRKNGFMGQAWHGGRVAFEPATWAAVLRVLKPGGHLLCFGGTRTQHRMVCAIEDAGFEIRDSVSYLYDGGLPGPLLWCYGSGFPKSHNVSNALNEHRCMCAVREHSTVSPTISTRPILQSDVCRGGKADTSNGNDLRGLQPTVDTKDEVSSGTRDDVFQGVSCHSHFDGEDGGVAGGTATVPDMRDTSLRSAFKYERGGELLQSAVWGLTRAEHMKSIAPWVMRP